MLAIACRTRLREHDMHALEGRVMEGMSIRSPHTLHQLAFRPMHVVVAVIHIHGSAITIIFDYRHKKYR